MRPLPGPISGSRLQLTLLAALLLPPLPAKAQRWTSYNFPADGFSIRMPAAPTLTTHNVATLSGAFPMRTYLLEGPELTLLIAICDYGLAGSASNPQALLQGAKSGLLSNSNSRLLHEKRLPPDGLPGLEFESEAAAPALDRPLSAPAHFLGHLYLIGGTLYQLLAAYPAGQSAAPARRFLDSFQRIPRTQP